MSQQSNNGDLKSGINYPVENDPRGMVNFGAELTEELTKLKDHEKKENETTFIDVSEQLGTHDVDGYSLSKNPMQTIKEDDETDREIRSQKGSQRGSQKGSQRGSRRPSMITIRDDTDSFEDEEREDKEEEKKEDDNLAFVGESIFSRRMIIAGGFLDIALFTTNCEQLKSILEIGHYHSYYELVLGLIVCSMVLQIACGFTLFMAGCVTIKVPDDKKRTDVMNHISMGLVALITVVNIFISSFTVKGEVLQRCIRGDLI